MENLSYKGTESSPKIEFNCSTGIFIMSGTSMPEDPAKFYSKVLLWMGSYAKNPAELTKIDFDFKYFNSSSLKYLLRMLVFVKDIEDAGKKAQITWHYKEEDTSMLESGTLLNEISELEFVFQKK